MRSLRSCLTLVTVAALSWPVLAGGLGEKAPPLKIKQWVKGKPVDVTSADGRHVYVVEFWATWCGPCIHSIPHLTEMQKKFKDSNVVFVGVSVDDEHTVARVEPFVAEMGEKMDYTVAIDDNGQTAKAYLDAHYVNGIPHAFVIDQRGRLVWHGHPQSDLEQVIEQVVSGKFDLAAAKKRMAPVYEQRRREWTLRQHMREYFELVGSAGNEQRAAELGRKILELGRKDAQTLNSFAWAILTREGLAQRDYKLALRAAEMANEASKGEDAAILDTYALALFENGRKQEAVRVQQRAVELASKQYPDEAALLAELKQRLERFRKEAD